jgi:hypothetical protein
MWASTARSRPELRGTRLGISNAILPLRHRARNPQRLRLWEPAGRCGEGTETEQRAATVLGKRPQITLEDARPYQWPCQGHRIPPQPSTIALPEAFALAPLRPYPPNLAKTSFPPVRKYPTVFRTRASS